MKGERTKTASEVRAIKVLGIKILPSKYYPGTSLTDYSHQTISKGLVRWF